MPDAPSLAAATPATVAKGPSVTAWVKEPDGIPQGGSRDASAADLGRRAAEAPVVRLVERVLGQAVRDRASDIHFEPFEGEFKVRCRVDGTLREVAAPPPELALPVISRLKVLAGLDIAERRAPQDGRIRFADAPFRRCPA